MLVIILYIADVKKVKDDSRYAKFFKMLKFGVPDPVVRQKMGIEGLDSSYLE